MPMPQAAFDAGRLREFRCPAESAGSGIEGFFQGAPRSVLGCCVEHRIPGRRVWHEPLKRQRELRALPANILFVVSEVLGNARQDVAEARHALTRVLGKIGPAEKGLLL